MLPTAIKHHSILAPVHPPNSLQMLPCVPLRRLKFACKRPYHHSQVAHLVESRPSLERRAQLGKDKLVSKKIAHAHRIQALQRSVSVMGPANTLYDDEIRVVRDHCRGHLQLHAR